MQDYVPKAHLLILTVSMLAGISFGCDVAPVKPITGGTGGQGGTGGAGGVAVVSCGSDNQDDLISDFMMDNGVSRTADGRLGGWYVYGDDSLRAIDPTRVASFDPPKNPDCTVAYPIDMTMGNPTCSGPGSLRVKGTGFTIWGAAIATDFVPPASTDDGGTTPSTDDGGTTPVDCAHPPPKASYDASKYKGVSFWAKATAPLSYVQVKFPDINTETQVPSPACILSAAGLSNNCSPYLVKFSNPDDLDYPNYQKTKIDTTWRRFDVMFADTKQDMFNPGYVPNPDKLDVAHILGMAIQVNANFSSGLPVPNNFELWIDDVRFIR